MAKLKPWYQVVTPREDLRDNKGLDSSEFAIHLDQIRDGRAPKDYIEPDRFFERTYITGSLLDLTSQVVRRLSGVQVETSSVFNMSTQFGGGKSHSLTALYHLAKNGEKAKAWKGVGSILAKAGVSTVPEAAFAVFMGKEFDSLNGRGGPGSANPDEPSRKTPWGEIAWQLGGAESFAVVERHERDFIEPKGDVIRAMLPKNKPSLILFDEVISYVSTYRKKGYGSQLYNFLDVLAETARGEKNVVVVASIPASDLEYTAEDSADEARFKKMLDRVGKAIMMSSDNEMGEIIRRRLFDWGGLPEEGRKTVAAYAEWATEHSKELTGFDADSTYERFAAAYPFHPSVLSVFERKWQSLPRFQRTRGVLRMLAMWVAYNYQEEHRKVSGEPLITLGLAPLDNPPFRTALFEQLGDDKLETSVTTDIVGKADAHGVRLDKEANETIRKAQLHRKVATTIFFESNGGMSQSKADASMPEIKTAVGGPDQNLVDVDNVVEGLASTCYYLNWERNRYRFGLAPNLNQILVNRRGAVSTKAIEDRIKKQIQTLFDKNSGEGSRLLDRNYYPARSNDVSSRPVLTLCVMGLDCTLNDKGSSALIESIIRDCGSSGRTYKSALLFAVPDTGDAVREAARNLLAWEDIDDDEDTKKRVDPAQIHMLKRNLDHAKRDLDESVFRTYRHVFLLGKDNKLQHVDLGQITSSSAGSIVELILRELGRIDVITEGVSPNKLLKYWPAALVEWSTQGVRDAFFSSPQLPRLLNAEALKRTICDGVSQGAFGYASKDSAGKIKLEKLRESLFDTDVDIANDVYIIKVEDAQKLLEPPKLAKLIVRPYDAVIKIGEQASFACSAVDQYGQPYPTPTVNWSATGGTISNDGLFTAGQTGGLFIVRAETEGFEAVAEVRVTTKDESPPIPAATGEQTLRWRGSVPPQKWMNLYTKVLTRFVSAPELKLEVTFEVPIHRDQAGGKLAETKAGLKELGLDDNVTLS
jgi:hypothetical protein